MNFIEAKACGLISDSEFREIQHGAEFVNGKLEHTVAVKKDSNLVIKAKSTSTTKPKR